MTISIDSSVLTAYYQARYGGTASTTASGSGSTTKKSPTAPWASTSTAPKASDLVKSVLAGGKFINPDAAKLDTATTSKDYKPLFAVYQALSALQGLATQMGDASISESRKTQIRASFNAGMTELGAYLDKNPFTAFQLAQASASDKIQSTGGVKRETDTYTTGTLASGSPGAEVPAFQGAVAFTMNVTKLSGAQVPIAFDLSEMGSTPRTMANVTIYMNDKLAAAGVGTRFAVVRTPGADRTLQVGKQTVTLGPGADTYALQIKGVSTETLQFSAAAAAPSVYLGTSVGQPAVAATSTTAAVKGTDQRQLFKFETDPAGGATDAADGKVFSKTFGPEVQAVRASQTGPDGSLYVLAEVNSATDGQTIKGQTDVALQKYDSAGNLLYTRTLGAANNAQGYALAVSADGSRVAVGGAVEGGFDSGDTVADAKVADSYVTVFDGEGQQVFSQRRGATTADQVDKLTFGADGTLYVQGTTNSSIGGQGVVGGQDSYIQALAANASPTAAAAYTSKFTVQYGTTGTDKAAGVAVDGTSLVVGGVENGRVVVRRYDLQATGAPTLGAVRDLGAVQGGGVAGVAIDSDGSVIVAGTTGNGALAAGAVTNAYTSGQAAFVAKLSGDLSASGGDRLTYLNGVGGDRNATAVTVAGGKVYLAGQLAVTPPPGQAKAYDGYATAIDPDTGAVSWSQTYRGADRTAAPTTIAVDTAGASVLDRIGLPRGTIDYTGSQQVVANTAARPGDQFFVRVGTGSAVAVTIEAGDTLKTLADKIGRASGFNAKVEIVADKGYDRLKITPANTRSTIQLEAGTGGRNALSALGLAEGIATTAPDKNPKDQIKTSYGLQLTANLNLDSDGQVKQANAQLLTAISTVKTIYQNLNAPLTSTTAAATGTVPAYLTDKIANYQQALARLTAS